MSPVEHDPTLGLNGAIAAVLRAELAARVPRMTQKDLSAASGVPIASLRRYLHCVRMMDMATIEALADGLELDPGYVVEQALARQARKRSEAGE